MVFDYRTITDIQCPVVKVVAKEHEGDEEYITLVEVMIQTPANHNNITAAERIALALTDWFEEMVEVVHNENRSDARKALLYTLYPPITSEG